MLSRRLGPPAARGATVLLAVFVLAGCNLYALPAGPHLAPLTIKILVDLPAPLEPAARLAIEQANAAHMSEFENLTLKEVVMDDTFQGSVDVGVAKERLRGLLQDDSVLAMVGPASLALATTELPVTNDADLATVSPTLSDDCLTQSHAYCRQGEPTSLRPHNATQASTGDLTFFRVPTTDDTQGSASADYLIDTLQKHAAIVVTDQTVSGQALRDAFKQEWSTRGGTLVAATQVNLSASTDLHDVATSVVAQKPDAVYFASNNEPAFANLAHALQGVPVTLIGTQADGTPQSLTDLAGASGDIHISSLATDAANRAPRFLTAYRTRYPADKNPAPFALEAYEATQSVIEGLRLGMAALAAQQGVGLPTRASIQAQMASASIDTEDLTAVSYDTAGDDTSRLITYYKLQDHAWVFDQQVTFGG